MKKYDIKLSFKELELIDGKVSEDAQKVIELARKENSFGFSLVVMNEILRKSEENGLLNWRYKEIDNCSYCDDKPRDYYTYPRSGKYHRKGEKNYSKPKYYSGVKFNEGFVTIQGQGDMCLECCEKHNVIKQLIDYILDNDLKIQIQKNDYKDSKYLKDDIRICYNCETEMKESEMGKSSTMMGDGNYPSTCPKCEAKGSAFGKSHITTNKFVHRINPLYSDEVQEIKEIIKIHNQNNEKDLHIKLEQLKRNENAIIVQETEFKNGYREVVEFDLVKKIYYVGHFWKDKVHEFVEVLVNNGYEETENKYLIVM